MSLQFSDTSTYRGIVQTYEREIGGNIGDVSNNTEALKSLTADVNMALDDFFVLAIKASGTWQIDDSNHTDYPIITTNLVSGQRDYSFTVDGSSNLILDIYKVAVKDTSGVFRTISPVDQQSQNTLIDNTDSFVNGLEQTGIPTRYDKTANGFFLDPVPNYNSTGGLKVYINREGSYFAYTDTTKKPGVLGLFHEYFALKPALKYARRFNLSSFTRLQNAVLMMEKEISEHFNSRQRDVKRRMVANVESNK